MPWEWIAPAGTSLVGLAGITATYLSGKRQTATAREVAQQQAEATLRAQREERNQRRIEAAYLPLLDVLAQGAEWSSDMTRYVMAIRRAVAHHPRRESTQKGERLLRDGDRSNGSDVPDPPPMPDDVNHLVNRGSLMVTWSPQVARLVHNWNRVAIDVDNCGLAFRMLRPNPSLTAFRKLTLRGDFFIPPMEDWEDLARADHTAEYTSRRRETKAPVRRSGKRNAEARG